MILLIQSDKCNT